MASAEFVEAEGMVHLVALMARNGDFRPLIEVGEPEDFSVFVPAEDVAIGPAESRQARRARERREDKANRR